MNLTKHKAKWKNCGRCELCCGRTRTALVRGTSLPAKVLLVGEAPGESEDSLGRPFVGPAGQLLDRMIKQAGLTSYALTNLIACIPKDDENNKLIVPPKFAVEACAPRLREVLAMCKPEIIVWVGKEAAKHGPKVLGWDGPTAEITHPSAIKRMSIAQQGLVAQRCVVTLTEVAEEYQ